MELQPAVTYESGPLAAIVRRAVRRGASVAPFGAVAGAALGLAGDGTEAMRSADVALLLAAVLGFGLVPMFASIITVARAVNRAEPELGHPLITGFLLSVAFGLAWAIIAAIVALAGASLVALNLDEMRLVISALTVGVVGGAILGLVSVGLVRLARRGTSSGAS